MVSNLTAVPFVNSCKISSYCINYRIVNIFNYVFILLLHTYLILFIYFLGDISISFAVLNPR